MRIAVIVWTAVNDAVSGILAGIFFLYVLTAALACAYYNWRYAQEHGFLRWLLLGELVASAKALVWPFFAFLGSQGRRSPSPGRWPPTARRR